MNRFLVVIPAHNEADTIYEVVTRALRHADVSVTDDGSRDDTGAILGRIIGECRNGKHAHRLNVVTHPTATHIPLGIQDGMKFACANDYDFVVTMDAGLSHDPDALPGFLAHDPTIDLVIGHRRRARNVPAYRRLISWLGSRLINYTLTPSYLNFRGKGLRDCTSGFRRYSRPAFTLISISKLKSKSFDFHMEALVLCLRSSMSVSEIPIDYCFSNSSFSFRVLRQAMAFGLQLIATKRG